VAFDFPSSPSNGQTFQSGGQTYVWNGYGWVMQGAVPAFTISDTAPVGAVAGQMWWESDSGILWMYYNDGTSSQWVEVGGGSGVSQTFTDANYAPIEALAASGMQVNGSFEVAQEFGLGTIVAVPSGTAKHVIDGCWQFYPSNVATFNARQSYAYPAAANGGLTGMTCCLNIYTTGAATPANNDLFVLQHKIEGWRTTRFRFGTPNAIPITVGFWFAGDATGTVGVSVRNADSSRSYVANVAVNATGTWEYKTVTIPGCTDGTWNYDIGVGMNIGLCFGATGTGFQATPNTWVATNAVWTSSQTNFFAVGNNDIWLTGFTVMPASLALTGSKMRYAMRPFDQELTLCQRYFEKSYNYDLAPGTVDSSGVETMTVDGLTSVSRVWQKDVRFKVPKRTSPTITLYSDVTGASGVIRNRQASTEMTASAQRIGHTGFQMTTSPSTDAAVAMTFHWKADVRL